MKNLLISIIVPIFNIEKYISECIESIQNQTYSNLQIILVDDGSSDLSGSICDKYALEDSRIEVIHQSNKGLVAARKSGLEIAKGRYIGFVDGDDSVEPDMYQMLMQEIEMSEADFVHASYWEGNLNKKVFFTEVVDLIDTREKFLQNVILKKGNYITPSLCVKLFKADLIKTSYSRLCDNSSFGEDLIALTVCILKSNRISIMDGCYYHYRVRKGSLSHKYDISDVKKIYQLYDDLCKILSSYGLYKDYEAIMDKFLWNNLTDYMSRINQGGFQIAKYFFKDVDLLCGKRIVIYGAGMVGRDYYAQICRYSDCKVVSWVDVYPEKYQYKHISLCGLNALNKEEFDIVVIAVLGEAVADDIIKELVKRGIDRKKIYWCRPERWELDSYFTG